MIETLVQPFQFPFMQAAFAVAAIIAVPTALLSCFLVLKGWSLMGDAVSNGSIQKVETSRFARADLENRLLMVDDDSDYGCVIFALIRLRLACVTPK